MKTSIDIDRELADEVAEILGTETLKDTVHLALVEVRRAELRRRLAERVRNGTLPVPTQEEYDEMRRPKLPIGAIVPGSVRGSSEA
jgi:Arc/MetJ family transcription regulator